MPSRHEICEHCGREIFYPPPPGDAQWLHWGSGQASCGLNAEPRRQS